LGAPLCAALGTEGTELCAGLGLVDAVGDGLLGDLESCGWVAGEHVHGLLLGLVAVSMRLTFAVRRAVRICRST
jgi:hypothetical protein